MTLALKRPMRAVIVNPTFEVVGGFHHGVSLTLDNGSYRIGSTPDADIVLKDQGVTADHAVLRVERGVVRVEATGGDVELGPDEVLPKGHGCRLRLPVDLALGEARIRLSPPDDRQTSFVPGALAAFVANRPLAAAGGLTACCLLAVSAVTAGLPPLTSDPNEALSSAGLTRVAYSGNIDDLEAGVRDQAGITPALIKLASEQLAGRIREAGITSLKIRAEDGYVAVSGHLTHQETDAWTAIQAWFDETYGGRLVLTGNVAIGETHSMPNLQLQAIWYGERPYVLTEQGTRYYEGAFLDNGWVIQKIGEDRIILAKEGEDETLALTYR